MRGASTYTKVCATAAVLLALATSAYAAKVGSADIANGTIREKDLAPNSVGSDQVINGSLKKGDLKRTLGVLGSGLRLKRITSVPVGEDEANPGLITTFTLPAGSFLISGNINLSGTTNQSCTQGRQGGDLCSYVLMDVDCTFGNDAVGTISRSLRLRGEFADDAVMPFDLAVTSPGGGLELRCWFDRSGGDGTMSVRELHFTALRVPQLVP